MIRLDPIEATNPWDPWLGIWVAVTRQTEGAGVLNPDQRLTRDRGPPVLHDQQRPAPLRGAREGLDRARQARRPDPRRPRPADLPRGRPRDDPGPLDDGRRQGRLPGRSEGRPIRGGCAMADHDRALAEAFDGQAERVRAGPGAERPGGPGAAGRRSPTCRPTAWCSTPVRARARQRGVPGRGAPGRRGRPLGRDGRPGPAPVRAGSATGPRSSRARSSTRCPAARSTRPSRGTWSTTSPTRSAFVRRQVELLRPGGVLVVCDHATDPDPARADHHERLERDRDTTHTRNLTAGGLADLLASAGLVEIRLVEEAFTLDFDEWFDRGTPARPQGGGPRPPPGRPADPRLPPDPAGRRLGPDRLRPGPGPRGRRGTAAGMTGASSCRYR